MERGGKPDEMNRRWKDWELEYLEKHAGEGSQAIADRLGRSKRAVEVMASKERISLGRWWICPKCGRRVYTPLTEWSGWCRRCSIQETRDRAAETNRRVRAELKEERRREKIAAKERQAIYSDTSRKRLELRRFRESRERKENRKETWNAEA